jgi:hypothetical protein
VFISIAVVAAVALGRAIWRSAFSHNSLPVTAEWIADLSQDSCPRILRLEGGPDGRLGGKLRRERCQEFDNYLQRLEGDFGRATLALKVLLLQSREDRPDLAATLLHHQMAFGCRMVSARARLFLYRWGLGSVDAIALVRVFDAVAARLRAALPAGVAA